ncbi:MAG: DUF1998 domain-containing protein [Cycloclasticus sp.]|nr:DUF1998 domain-containing protein [Cycloclasticus sp.]
MKNSDRYTPVRFSHLTGYAGVGSIVRDNRDFLMVVADIRYWTNQSGAQIAEPIRFVERLKKHLKISKDLRMPPTAQVGRDKVNGHPLPAVIFPSYAVCRYCNRLHHKPWNGVGKDISKGLVCENDACEKPGLEQVTWCAVSSDGDLRDVHWHSICHRNSKNKCEHDYGAAYLEILSGPRGKKHVHCTQCDAKEGFEQSDSTYQGESQPWIKGGKRDAEPALYTVMEINDPRVYIASKKRGIVIPPESNIDKNSITYKLFYDSVFLRKVQQESRGLKRKKLLITAANGYRCSVDEIKNALAEIEDGSFELDKITEGEMYSDEYKALITEESFKDGVDFVTKHKTERWLAYLELTSLDGALKQVSSIIDKVVAVDRLRVIEVFEGFSRRASDCDDKEKVVVSPDITNELNWLPAIELFGEGIFFTIDETVLNEWENAHEVRLRADEVNKRYQNSSVVQYENLPVVSPRFILLHTLSHLIIRELEISAGYPAASLKERIYHSNSKNNMAGILIYTAVADISGSLGGIVEAAEPKNFLKLLDGAFKHAQWCSLDPVCTEHEGQGPGWLNGAACHACSLIPETSCEYGNVFLDRVLIKGNESSKIPSVFK